MLGAESEHFKSSELACKCCGRNWATQKLVDALEALRAIIGKPMIVTSGCRCEEYNKKIKGATHSMHLLGKAVDFKVPGMTARELYSKARKVKAIHGIGVDDFNGMLHVDVRETAEVDKWCYNDKGAWVDFYDQRKN